MKNLKAIITYGVIIALCLAALAGYMISNRNSGGKEAAAAGSTETAAPSSAAAEGTAAAGTAADATVEETTAAPAANLSANAAERLEKSGSAPESDPVVGVGRGDDYETVTRKAIENAGGLEGVIHKGDTVLIKPNICTYAEPGSPMITDYRMVQEIVDICREYEAGKIIIAEGPITGLAFDFMNGAVNGYKNIKDVEFVELNDLDKEDCYGIKAEKSDTGKSFFIPKVYMDADVVISAPKLKTHFQPESYVSLCLKNMYGVPPGKIYGLGYKIGLHALGLKESLVDLSKIGRADFYVIDGIVGGEGYGPLNNQPVDSKIILAGKNPVAVDTAALTFMGFTVDEIPTVKLAAQENLGVADLAKIKVVGEDIEKAKMQFARP